MTRALDLRRLAMIGDSVFAVSITLNARAVTIPSFSLGATQMPGLGDFLAGVGAIVLSVIVASAFWLGHWRYFRHVRRASVSFIAAHFLFLLALILLPVCTDFYATNHLHPVATLMYGANLLLLAVVALLFRIVAIHHSPGRAVTPSDWGGMVGLIGLFALSVGLSFGSPKLAQMCWYVGLCSPLLETWLGQRKERRLHALQAPARTGPPPGVA